MQFLGLFRAKMNTIGIQNPKLIVTNDYQQFLAHFDWFLALFQISDVKPGKKISKVIFVPQSKFCQKIGSKWPLNWFLYSGCIPEAASCRVKQTFYWLAPNKKDLLNELLVVAFHS